MHRFITVVLCLSFFALACEKYDDPAAVRKALTDDVKTFVEAVNKKDITRTVASYWNSPELVAYYPDGAYHGYDAVKASWENLYQDFESVVLQVPEIHVSVGKDMAYRWGTYTFTLKPKDGPQMSTTGRYCDIWAKKEGKWVVVLDHASLPTPPPPPPAPPQETKGNEK